jgi:alpha-mannosidase
VSDTIVHGNRGQMDKQGNGLSRRDFLIQGTASLGAMAAAPAFAQHAPDVRSGSTQVLHIIGYSHIDAAWLWPWRDGSDTVLTTFRSALNRISETPGFCYSHSSSTHYRWVERTDPEMLSEIKQRIREGRWEVVGGWPVEPDCNIPSTESFVRHALYGKTYCQRALGAEVKIGFNPDSFGHAAGLPAILKRAGYGYYVFMRPQEHEMELPLLFWWESADGSRVLTLRIWHSYDAGPQLIQPAATGAFAPGFDHAAFFLGVGDHGGAVTREQIQQILALQHDVKFAPAAFQHAARFLPGGRKFRRISRVARGPGRVAAPRARLLFGLWRGKVP